MTDLFKQLQSLKASIISSPSPVSFLFDIKTSNQIDKDIIFTIGLNGLEELTNEDDSFLLFQSDLFTESFAMSNSQSELRSASTQELIKSELIRITQKISKHFLRPGCHKIIEFLLRFYQFHSCCTSEIIYHFLPFHGSKFFIRLLQVLPLTSFWHFLTRHQQTGYVLQRADIVKQVIHEPKLLQGIIETAEVSQIHLKFVVVLIIETVNSLGKLGENFMIDVMGLVNRLLQGSGEFRLMGFSIVAHFAKKHVFSPHYLHGIIADVIKFAEGVAVREVLVVNLLIRIHMSKSLPKMIVEDLIQPQFLNALPDASKNTDLNPLISVLIGKVLNLLTKRRKMDEFEERVVDNALVFVRDLELSLGAKEVIIQHLFTQYLNIEKSKFELVSSRFVKIINVFYQVHGDSLVDLVSKAVSQESRPDSKQKLYNFISQGFSSLPFDPSTDLPLILGLSHKSALIRKSALLHLNSPSSFSSSLLSLFEKESDYEVFSCALDLDLSPDYFEVLLKRLQDFLSFPSSPRSLCQKLFKILSHFPIQDSRNARLILQCYDSPMLREMVTPALQASNYDLFTGYCGEDLSIFLKKKFLNHWAESAVNIMELLDCPLVFSLIPEIFEEISQNSFIIPSLIQVAGHFFEKIIKTQSIDLSPAQTIVRSLPGLKNLDKQLSQTYQSHLLKLLTYAIPISPDTCKEVLAKYFSETVLETLCGLQSPEALHLASCVSFHSEASSAFVYVLPFILVALSKSPDFRTSALICIEQFVQKSLPEVKIEFAVHLPSDLKIDLSGLNKFLKKILRFRAGIIQDPDLIFYCMGKIKTNQVVKILAAGLQAKGLDHQAYFQVLRPVKSDLLTDALLSSAGEGVDCVDRVEVLKRLETYNGWNQFPYTQFLVQSMRNFELLQNVLNVLTPARFKKVPQEEILESLFEYLPCKATQGISSSQMREITENVKDYLDSLDLPVSIYLNRFKISENTSHLEYILQLLQNRPQNFEVLECLMKVLIEITEKAENLRDQLLVTIRIHGSQAKVPGQWLEDIASIMYNTKSIETKKSAMMALCSFNQDTSAVVIDLIEKAMINVSSFEEYSFFKSVLWKFSNQDIANILRRLMIYAETHHLGIKEAENLIKLCGNRYLHIFLEVFLHHKVDQLFESLLKIETSQVIQSFTQMLINNLSSTDLIIFTFAQEKFVERFSQSFKSLSITLSELFLVIFGIVVDSKRPENRNSESKPASNSLLKALESALNEKMLESTFFYILKDPSYLKTKEAAEFLLPHVEKNPTSYFGLINPLCEIIENHSSKANSLKSEKMQNLAVYLQTVFSLLYLLLKFYSKTGDVLVMYCNSFLAFVNCRKFEVRCAACLTFSTFFREKNVDLLPFVSNFVEKSLDLSESLNETFRAAGFSCLVESLKTCDEFLSPYMDKIIQVACKFSDKGLSKVLVSNVSNRFFVGSLKNAALALAEHPDHLSYFFNLSLKVFEKVKTTEVAGFVPQVFDYFREIFRTLSTKPAKIIKKCVEGLSKSFASFALNLKNSQLKPNLMEFYSWTVEKNEEERWDYSRLYLFVSLIHALTRTLKQHFLVYYSHFIDLIYDVFEEFSAAYSTKKRKRSKGKILQLVNYEALACVEWLAASDNEKFLNTTRQEKLSEIISAEFRCIHLKNFPEFSQSILIAKTSKILLNSKDLQLWQSFTNKILFNTRSSNAEVRFQSLSFVSKSLSLIGKEYAALVGDIMPYVVQGLEDSEDKVVDVAKTLMAQLETYCGDEIKNYIS